MTSQSVDLITNYYRIYSKDHDLAETLHQYEIVVSLSDETLGGDTDEQTLPLFIKQMSDQQNIPVELRRKIVSAAVDRWLAAEKLKPDERFVRCDLDCNKLITNFDLHKNKLDTKLLNVPYRRGNLRLSTVVFSIQLKKTKFDYLNLLNIVIGVDGRSSPTLVEQSLTSTTQYTAGDVLDSDHYTQLLRGQIITIESQMFGPALCVRNLTGRFRIPLDKERNLVDYVRDSFGFNHSDCGVEPSIVSSLNKELPGRQVGVSHILLFDLPRRVQICKIEGTANDPIDSSKKQSIQEYFKSNYGVQLEFPGWPCVVVQLDGEEHRVPMELCRLYQGEKPTVRDLDRNAYLEPRDHFVRIERHIKSVIDSREAELAKIGISIDVQPLKVAGQVLVPVSLVGKSSQSDASATIKPENCRYDASAAKFLRPAKLDKFSLTLAGFTTDSMSEYGNLKKFIRKYCRVGRCQGVEIGRYMAPPIDIIIERSDEAMRRALKKHVEQLSKQSYDLAIIVMPENVKRITSLHFLETQLNHSTGRKTRLTYLKFSIFKQILRDAKSENDTLLQDLWMKCNSQLGGLNYVLNLNADQVPSDNFLVFGVDVRHPDLGEKFSVIAVVGLWSINSEGHSHSTQLRVRPARPGDESSIEQMTDVGLMLDRILNSYHTKPKLEKRLPSEIVILLNGTREETFKVDETSEFLDKILGVSKERYARIGQAEPCVSCFKIHRRHDIHFKLNSRKNATTLPPGTIVADSNLLGHNAFAFYADPKSDFYGSTEPLIVSKLKDGIPSMTDLKYQQLIMALCYLSPSTKCTILPAPIDLAEKASQRGKDIAPVWAKECFAEGNWLEQLKAYFSDLSKDSEYLETLFYV